MMTSSKDTISINKQDKSAQIPKGLGIWLVVLLSFNIGPGARATIVTIDVPSAAPNVSYLQDFSVLDPFEGTLLNGQSESVNIFFTDSEFLVAAGASSFTVDLFINESGPVGAQPANGYSVTGYLIDAAGNPLSPSIAFPDSGTIPAQVWTGWPFYLPGGTEYLPATQMFEAQFGGTRIYGNPSGYYINPVIFSGIHFDITFPVSPMNVVMGGRLVIANFVDLILTSPSAVPVYFVDIPEPSLELAPAGSPDAIAVGNTNSMSLQLSGTPEYPYILQSATNLTYPINWQSVMTNSADSNGAWNIAITNSGPPSEFFRVVAWPGSVQQ
ncbi:MAG TPA: hypothetical protein VGJ73_11600 [Verrucomicrobiae bacterium]|jgi:hypothetical protein